MASVLGGLTDRLPRRALVVGLELSRAGVLLATAIVVADRSRWGLIIPILLVLSCINAIVQPARQAAVASLVPAGQVGKANAVVAAVTMLSSAVGFGVAAAILGLFPRPTSVLFVADAATFALAAAIVVGIPSLGGGSIAAPISGALRRSWDTVAARPHLVVGTLAAFLIPISYPALLSLAYQLGQQPHALFQGGPFYSVLELVSSMGIFVGSLLISRLTSIGSMRTVGAGLLLTGVFSFIVSLNPGLGLIAVGAVQHELADHRVKAALCLQCLE